MQTHCSFAVMLVKRLPLCLEVLLSQNSIYSREHLSYELA